MEPCSRVSVLCGLLLWALAGCSESPSIPEVPLGPEADAQGHTAPTSTVQAVLRERMEGLDLGDPGDLEAARRGFVAREERLQVAREGAEGRVWDRPAYDFLDGSGAPDSVNPSLWRQAQLNNLHGLFEVAPGIHQVRGYDLANMTLIDGETGWIVVDPLGSAETGAAALALARKHLGDRPVRAVILTHSHVDHFGGILGVTSAQEVAAGSVRVVAPKGFLHEATSENLLAGPAMARRAAYMYGFRLARSPRGHVDSGLGKEPGRGSTTILPPTDLVEGTPQEMTLDGLRFVFQYAPETEAPAELMFHLPDQKAFCSAEVTTRTMHNLYTLRGAKVRDALRWSAAIDDALQRFGPDTEVLFASHHWPVWGGEEVAAYLERQRDTYKYLHDQTLRLANAGLTPREIAEQLELPPSLQPHFSNRGYYGTVRHNAKAVYQAYFGWYDGNPAHLDPLPPAAAATRYVEAMGGAEAVLEQGRGAFEQGEYRWASMLLDHLVFADPGHAEARALLARTYDQLGYLAESAPWRDVYLSGAYELRHGPPPPDAPSPLAGSAALVAHIPVARFLDALAARIDGVAAAGRDTRIKLVFTDLGETHVLELSNAVLHHRPAAEDAEADATIRLTHAFFLKLLLGQGSLREMLFSEELDVEGSRLELVRFFGLLDPLAPNFAIVTP